MPERGQDVLCYHCNDVFPHDEFGLMCPRCGSDFTEIIEGSAEEQQQPSEDFESLPPFSHLLQPRPSQSPRSPRYENRNPLLDHNPWADTPPDDEAQGSGNNGPRISRRSYRSPDGRVTFTSTTFTTGMGGRNRSRASPETHPVEPLLQTVGSIFQELAGAYNTNAQNRHVPPPDREDPWETPGATRGPNLQGGLWPRDTDSPQPPTVGVGNIDDIFDLLRTGAAGEGFERPRGGIHIVGTTGMGPMHPLSLLAGMLGGGRVGDAVYSQEELDRVISQLVDQNMNQGVPPATESAIHSLPKKIVDKEMLGVEGKAECSICMDAVDIGTEVTELPCKHWFHGECIEMWLKQHNTCPHCRRGIDQGENAPGTRNNPVFIPSSPPQSPPRRRSSGYNQNTDHSGSTYRTHHHRDSSGTSIHSPNRSGSNSNSPLYHTASAPPESRQEYPSGNESQTPPPQSNTNGGGVTGWLRSRFGGS